MAETEHSSPDDSSAAAPKEPKGGRPGPADQGGAGGMATRENAPEVAETEAREGTD